MFFLGVQNIFPQETSPATRKEIPGHFSGIHLGMTIEEVREALAKDGNFSFNGDPEISILQRPNETLLECRGTFYISKGFFQFYKEKLYTIILLLDPDEIDHYSVYTVLSGKYGEPDYLDPKKAYWESDKYMLVLERPLSVKYIDRRILETIRTSGRTEETLHQLSRKQFLQQF